MSKVISVRRNTGSTVNVIRDIRNSARDYRLPREYAEREFDAGRLEQVQAGNGRWVYHDPRGRHLHAAFTAA